MSNNCHWGSLGRCPRGARHTWRWCTANMRKWKNIDTARDWECGPPYWAVTYCMILVLRGTWRRSKAWLLGSVYSAIDTGKQKYDDKICMMTVFEIAAWLYYEHTYAPSFGLHSTPASSECWQLCTPISSCWHSRMLSQGTKQSTSSSQIGTVGKPDPNSALTLARIAPSRYPSILHTVLASSRPQRSSQIVPHSPSMLISTRPVQGLGPLLRRTMSVILIGVREGVVCSSSHCYWQNRIFIICLLSLPLCMVTHSPYMQFCLK